MYFAVLYCTVLYCMPYRELLLKDRSYQPQPNKDPLRSSTATPPPQEAATGGSCNVPHQLLDATRCLLTCGEHPIRAALKCAMRHQLRLDSNLRASRFCQEMGFRLCFCVRVSGNR
ncbi:hypothetical protein K432DRAFT_172878 [Lepidopterella palustris CBS 459.81]|uniref:Uncharacterized protein n=1 Tax=Lepidopterella palustris CBS 459.81 TaxID=1314670 RepID=A0A8E2E1B7_9PEZI|nr:hypothetical protein K432DRAFT_172878 [Lepidopterella palustris CBS 459.81]